MCYMECEGSISLALVGVGVGGGSPASSELNVEEFMEAFAETRMAIALSKVECIYPDLIGGVGG